jgi:hypothetical protein
VVGHARSIAWRAPPPELRLALKWWLTASAPYRAILAGYAAFGDAFETIPARIGGMIVYAASPSARRAETPDIILTRRGVQNAFIADRDRRHINRSFAMIPRQARLEDRISSIHVDGRVENPDNILADRLVRMQPIDDCDMRQERNSVPRSIARRR